jgi:hypothetical protein
MKNRNNIYKCIITAVLCLCIPKIADAQKWAVSTNALQWASLGTINAEASYSLNRHITLNAGAVANPWDAFSPTYVKLKNNQYGGYLGAKYWPWHVFSEWWIGAKVQYKNFEQVGILTSKLVRGDALGVGISGGYSFMLGNHFNLDLGAGVWGGSFINYQKYKGTNRVDHELKEEGGKGFFFLDNLILSLTYIF